jgi:hypothetical protein
MVCLSSAAYGGEVLCSGFGLQVVRLYASAVQACVTPGAGVVPVVALVVHVESVGDGSDHRLVDPAVRPQEPSLISDDPVALGVDGTLPRPALLGLVHVPLEAASIIAGLACPEGEAGGVERPSPVLFEVVLA